MKQFCITPAIGKTNFNGSGDLIKKISETTVCDV